MKKKLTTLKLILALLLVSPLSTFAITYPLYLCGSATAKLHPDIAGLQPTDNVVWVDVTSGTNVPLKTVPGNGVIDLSIAPSMPPGEYTYRVHAVSTTGASCLGDYTEFKFYVLPPIVVNLDAPSMTEYCENVPASKPTILAKVTALPTGPDADIEFQYAWSGKKGTTAITDLTPIGSGSGATFTMSATTTTAPAFSAVGSYTFAATATYVLKSGSTSILKTDCSTTSADSQTIKVNAKPGSPTISII